jgi:two-component system phosphate regulon sensor histidine kinase PhoR
MMLLTVLSLVVLSLLLCLVFYGRLSDAVYTDIRALAETFRDNDSVTAIEAFAQPAGGDLRITIISPEGRVIFDNTISALDLPDHSDRQEVRQAIDTGAGEARRFSDTLDEETWYYAVRMTDGYILRAAKTTGSMLGMFGGSLPVVIDVIVAMIIACYILAGGLTKRILDPITKVDLNNGGQNEGGALPLPYDELSPFAAMISQQRQRIQSQIEDLRQRTDTIEAILDNMSEGILLLDKGGAILTINKSAAAFFAVSHATGKNILELFREKDILEHIRSALAGNRSEINLSRQDKIYRMHCSPVADSGAIILFMDITETTKAETLRQEFSANVSHELKTPLTTIYGYAEMLHNGIVKDEDKPVFYGHMKDEAARLIALIENILLVSRLDEKTGQEPLEDVELAAVIGEVVESLTPKAAANNISFRLFTEKVTLRANCPQMHELFYNLIDNAIKYNKPGGVISLGALHRAGQLRLTVADTGIGIPREAQDRVFERFFRVDRSRSKKTGGAGLGLAIVKHIVMAHHGRIELKSQVGEGTEINIYFDVPVDAAAAGEPPVQQ